MFGSRHVLMALIILIAGVLALYRGLSNESTEALGFGVFFLLASAGAAVWAVRRGQ